jgi:hypothetical protein
MGDPPPQGRVEEGTANVMNGLVKIVELQSGTADEM